MKEYLIYLPQNISRTLKDSIMLPFTLKN